MLNQIKHTQILGEVLRAIYQEKTIAPLLGFKGGTAAYLFYDLPRVSVDLDFDLLTDNLEEKERVFAKVLELVSQFGDIKDQMIKGFTLLFEISYGSNDQNIKVEISTRTKVPDLRSYFEVKEYLGISMLVAKPEYMMTSKLVALTQRKNFAMRDAFDVYYFMKKRWNIEEKLLVSYTNKSITQYLSDCIEVVDKIPQNQLLRGLGELLDEKQKVWVKDNLKDELKFLLLSRRESIILNRK